MPYLPIECRLGSVMEVAMVEWINLNGSCVHVMCLLIFPSLLEHSSIGGNALGLSILA